MWLLGLGAASAVLAREVAEQVYHAHRADLLEAVPAGERPAEIRALAPTGSDAWAGAPREEIESRIREEWSGTLPYGAVRPGVPVWLTYPLVTTVDGGRVLVPVVERSDLPIRGVLSLPGAPGPRRVVVLIDASLSANVPIRFRASSGRSDEVSVLEAERRALEHILDLVDDDEVQLGVIAFGEGTWPVAEPGTPVEGVRERLEVFRDEHPEGEGRTDLVCALWLARDWLDASPEGYARELVLLTDGDLPHSGRFLDCRMRRKLYGKDAEARCEARRNRTVCPASHEFMRAHGHSDSIQLSYFARKARRSLKVYPLVFEPDRSARAYGELASTTGGELVRVPSPAAIEAALPALVTRDIRAVFARNEQTGASTGNIFNAENGGFEGELELAPGANDVELRVEGERGVAGLFRFRIYSAPRHLQRYLAELRETNRGLEVRVEELVKQVRPRREGLRRSLEVVPDDLPPAAPAQ
jgi:hypothetical protein